MGGAYRFTKDERLRHKADFQNVFQCGRRFSHAWMTMLVLHPSATPFRRLGIVVSRKYGHAVRRNRAKRVLREIFRLNKNCLAPQTDLVILPKNTMRSVEFKKWEPVVIGLWQQAGVWQCENS